jgi:hypothetical protein
LKWFPLKRIFGFLSFSLSFICKKYAIQPPTFGLQKFRKKKNLGKYVLGIHLGASQLPGVPLSLKSLLHDTGIDRTGKYAVEWETD